MAGDTMTRTDVPSMSTETAAILGLVLVLFDWVIRIIALIVIPRDRKPTAAMAWLLAIFLIPFVGIVLFLVIGNVEAAEEAARAADRDQPDDRRAQRGSRPRPRPRRRGRPGSPRSSSRTSALGALPAVGGNTADAHRRLPGVDRRDDRRRSTPPSDFVHVEFFIVVARRHDRAASSRPWSAPCSAASSCACCSTTSSTARSATHKATYAELDRIGVKWSYMLPVQPFKGKYQRPDLRNHRKLVVVDGRVGYMGSQNLIDRSYNSPKNLKRGLQWQELVTRVDRPDRHGDQRGLPVGLVRRDRRAPRRRRERAAADGRAVDTSPDALDCQVVPSGPGVRRREQPAAVPLARERRRRSR